MRRLNKLVFFYSMMNIGNNMSNVVTNKLTQIIIHEIRISPKMIRQYKDGFECVKEYVKEKFRIKEVN